MSIKLVYGPNGKRALLSFFIFGLFYIFKGAEMKANSFIFVTTRPVFFVGNKINNFIRLQAYKIKTFFRDGQDILLILQENRSLLQENANLKKLNHLSIIAEQIEKVSKEHLGYQYVGAKVLSYHSPKDGIISAIVKNDSLMQNIPDGAVVTSNGNMVGKVLKTSSLAPYILIIQLAHSTMFSIPAKSISGKYYFLRGEGSYDSFMKVEKNNFFTDEPDVGEVLFVTNVAKLHLPEVPIGRTVLNESGDLRVKLFENTIHLDNLEIIVPRVKFEDGLAKGKN